MSKFLLVTTGGDLTRKERRQARELAGEVKKHNGPYMISEELRAKLKLTWLDDGEEKPIIGFAPANTGGSNDATQ